jgi:hypothetical protein
MCCRWWRRDRRASIKEQWSTGGGAPARRAVAWLAAYAARQLSWTQVRPAASTAACASASVMPQQSHNSNLQAVAVQAGDMAPRSSWWCRQGGGDKALRGRGRVRLSANTCWWERNRPREAAPRLPTRLPRPPLQARHRQRARQGRKLQGGLLQAQRLQAGQRQSKAVGGWQVQALGGSGGEGD